MRIYGISGHHRVVVSLTTVTGQYACRLLRGTSVLGAYTVHNNILDLNVVIGKEQEGPYHLPVQALFGDNSMILSVRLCTSGTIVPVKQTECPNPVDCARWTASAVQATNLE